MLSFIFFALVVIIVICGMFRVHVRASRAGLQLKKQMSKN
jgi:hypothetical protein